MPGKQYTKGDSITLTSASTDIWVRAVYEKIETECDKYGHLFIYAPYFQQHKATCSRCGYETTESHTLNAEQTQCTKCGAYQVQSGLYLRLWQSPVGKLDVFRERKL